MNNASLPWLAPAWASLVDYFNAQRIPHALLIAGANGLGKRQLAEQFAQLLLCEAPRAVACGECRSCELVSAGFHPDLHRLAPDAKTHHMTIDQIRELVPKLGLCGHYSTRRIVLMERADALNVAAANCLLKTLEEPVPGALLLLLTDLPERLPATIRSRCQSIRIASPSQAQSLQWLAERGVSDAALRLNIAHGRPLLAESLPDETLRRFAHCKEDWLSLMRRELEPIEVAERWQTVELAVLVDWLLVWAGDAVKEQLSMEVSDFGTVNRPTSSSSRAAVNSLRLLNWVEFLYTTKRELRTQINRQLLLERVLLTWSECVLQT